MAKLVMRFTWHTRIAACLAIFLTAACLLARPTADCLSFKAAFCAVEKFLAEVPDVVPPVSALPAAVTVAAISFAGTFLFFRPDLRVRIPISAQVTRLPWRDRHLPYTVATRDH